MITDIETNLLYLADCLPVKQPVFFERFEKVLKKNDIPMKFLSDTLDIWAVDYMPVQVKKDKFIQFDYRPGYLETEEDLLTIPNVDSICKKIEIKTHKSSLCVDGGNVVRSQYKVIMSDSVFKENKLIDKNKVIDQLKIFLEVEHLLFLPKVPYDIIGHADGMVRFIDNDTLLINDFSNESPSYQKSFSVAIKKTGLNCVRLPYNPPIDKGPLDATCIYINYLQMQQAVFVPVFKNKLDDKALRVMEDCFIGQTIIPVESNELSVTGGILNCISWNIKQ